MKTLDLSYHDYATIYKFTLVLEKLKYSTVVK